MRHASCQLRSWLIFDVRQDMHAFGRLAFLLLVLLASGCTTWTKKGDVTVSDGKQHWGILMAPPAYYAKFPRVRIGVVGSTTIRARDLPAPIFPEYAHLDVPETEDRGWVKGQPWRVATIRFTFRSVDGAILSSKTVALEDWQGGSEPGRSSSTRAIYFRISPWGVPNWVGLPPPPNLVNYDLIVEVLTPSPRPNDSLTMRAWLPIPTRPEPNKAPEPTPTAVTPRAIGMKCRMKKSNLKCIEARVAPAVVVAHL
jgi:hypothetical protein